MLQLNFNKNFPKQKKKFSSGAPTDNQVFYFFKSSTKSESDCCRNCIIFVVTNKLMMIRFAMNERMHKCLDVCRAVEMNERLKLADE